MGLFLFVSLFFVFLWIKYLWCTSGWCTNRLMEEIFILKSGKNIIRVWIYNKQPTIIPSLWVVLYDGLFAMKLVFLIISQIVNSLTIAGAIHKKEEIYKEVKMFMNSHKARAINCYHQLNEKSCVINGIS